MGGKAVPLTPLIPPLISLPLPPPPPSPQDMLLRSRSRYHDLLMAGAGQQVAALMERDGLEEAAVLRGEAQLRGARALGLPLVLEGAQGMCFGRRGA